MQNTAAQPWCPSRWSRPVAICTRVWMAKCWVGCPSGCDTLDTTPVCAEPSCWGTNATKVHSTSAGAPHRACRGPTQRAPGPDAESAGPRHRERIRSAGQRAPGPSAGARHKPHRWHAVLSWGPVGWMGCGMRLVFVFQSMKAPHKLCLNMLVACHVRNSQHEIAQYAIRKRKSLQLFTPCFSAHTVWGLCWYNCCMCIYMSKRVGIPSRSFLRIRSQSHDSKGSNKQTVQVGLFSAHTECNAAETEFIYSVCPACRSPLHLRGVRLDTA